MKMSPFTYQCLVVASPVLAAFSVGGAVIYPSLLMRQLSTNSSVLLDVHTRSWIGSIYGLAGIFVILMPVITQKMGRKFGYILACLYVLVGWILTYTASSATGILVSEGFHGLGVNSLLPVGFLSMSEMLASNYRSATMQVYGLAQVTGMAVSGILGQFIHFKTISIIMFVPIAIAVIIASLWPESPPWLACKGRFEDCKKAFVTLRGTDKISANELNDLITAQREILNQERSRTTLHGVWRQITSRDFYMPTLHTFLLMNMLYWSGCDVNLIYFLDMASKSTTNENATFYAAIVMYVILVVGLIINNILVGRFDNKIVLLTSSSLLTMFLISSCVITGLQSLGVVSKDSLLCLISMMLCISSACIGVDSIAFTLSAELMPVKHRSLGGALYIVFNSILYASSQKLSPYLFMYIDLWGTFLLYTINAIVCSLFVWKFVPETKRRSLQEIEDFYMYGKFISRDAGDIPTLIDKTYCEPDNDHEMQNTRFIK